MKKAPSASTGKQVFFNAGLRRLLGRPPGVVISHACYGVQDRRAEGGGEPMCVDKSGKHNETHKNGNTGT